MPEAVWFESRRYGALVELRIVARFGLGGRNISNRFEQATIVEPVDPFESGEFDRLGTAPRTAPMDDFGFEQSIDGFSERIVITVTDAADRWLNASVKQALGVANRQVKRAILPVLWRTPV